jgi:hypothetical protein
VKWIGRCLLLLFAPLFCHAVDSSPLEARLADAPAWHGLLHYIPDRVGSGFHSEVDAPEFFLADTGKTDPAAELRATLRRLRDDPQARCRFPARYRWLAERFELPAREECAAFATWLEQIQPVGASLVFAAAYMNNPASMFGHAMLRFDQAESPSRLLDPALDYGALTGPDGIAEFLWKGTSGGYRGYFSVSPYSAKVKQYGDWENRDLWEYRLEFSAEEIQRLLEHLWELDKVYFDYYFFDENCAYHLLRLLETARPGLDLRGGLRPWVLPGDVLRAVLEVPGLARQPVYRPARVTALRRRLQALDAADRAWVSRLAEADAAWQDAGFQAMEAEQRAKLLELAHSHGYSLHLRQRGADPAMPARLRDLLLQRSRLGSVPPVENAPPPHPGEAHRPLRLGLGIGHADDGAYTLLQFRPLYHDLLDPRPGYADGAQIGLFDLQARYYANTGKLRLERMQVLEVVSLADRDEFFQPLSWKLNVEGARRNQAMFNATCRD